MKVFIADDEKKVRNAIRLLIESDDQMHICAEAANRQELFSYLNFCKPDILLLDTQLPGIRLDPQIMASLRAAIPAMRIILMTVDVERKVLLLNADAVISKCSSPQIFLSTLQQFAQKPRTFPISTARTLYCS